MAYRLAIALIAILWAGPVLAHAFGQRYDLPLPLSLFLWGAGAAVAVSFAVVALSVRDKSLAYPRLDFITGAVGRLVSHPALLLLLRLIAVAVFILVIVAGFIGIQNQFKNIAPTLVWVLWWIGFAYLSALLGDLWRLVNPIATLFRWGEALVPGLGGERPWPSRLGVWPAAGFFFLFAWTEIVWLGGETPRTLSLLVLTYAVIAWAGMLVWGRETWLAHGEAFQQVFGLLARFAPFAHRREETGRGRLELRPPAVGLLSQDPVSPSLMGFVVLILATVTFDGFRETPLWVDIMDLALESKTLHPVLFPLHQAGLNIPALVTTIGLIVFPVLFLGVYLGFAALMRLCAGEGPEIGETARRFVLTLVPIAIAYHLAHYMSLLLVAGQLVIPLASDPFGFGWDLFETKLYRIRLELVSAKMVWYTAVVAVVLGHIAAVYLAHRIAFSVYRTVRAALLSQIPMLVLMVAYTMVSLWILAQPVVEP